jgi:RNA polymerase sigma factor (sigma-70 family)
MRLADDGSTSPQLLTEVANWGDHLSWVRFRDRYDPLLWRWCRGYGLDEQSVDEVCEAVWIKLAEKMRTFQYDPSRTFRGWLRRLCESRVVDFLRERRARSAISLDERDEPAAGGPGASLDAVDGDGGERDEDLDPVRLAFLRKVEQVQASVRTRVKPDNWDAFWLVAVCDWSVERTAQSLGMTHAAVYKAKQRVARMLREEGQRLSEGGPKRSS